MVSGVPKFTSFRPKSKDAASLEKEPTEPEHRERSARSPNERSSSESKKPSRKRDSERGQRPEKTILQERTPETSTLRQKNPRRAESTSLNGPSKSYFSDRRGDRDIVRYGSLNRHDVPDYRRFGCGYVLGLALDWKIDRNLSTEKAIVLTTLNGRRKERLLTNKHAVRERTKAIRFVRRSKENDVADHDRDFIALSTTRKRKRGEHESDGGADGDLDYRGIQDTNTSEPADSDAEYEHESVVNAVNADVTARNSVLVRRTKDHPEDLQAWIELIEYQEDMMKMERSSTELCTTDKMHLAEIRVSIYEQALKNANSDEHGQVKLYCGMMTEAARAWHEEQMARKWAEVLAKLPFSAELWLKYLDWLESSFISFRYEACITTFQQCLKTMQMSTTAIDPDLSLYIFCRLTSLIHQAGYQEIALAIWQALLEYHALAPTDPPRSLQTFEEFWESEAPRIGEDNAKGWRNSNMDDNSFLEADIVQLIKPDTVDAIWDDFRKREVDHISKLQNPGRTIDELGKDDPFHMVLFSDIEVYLKLLPRSCGQIAMISAFLQFCDLPPLESNGSYVDRYTLDPFLRTGWNEAPQEDPIGFTGLITKYTKCPIQKFQSTPQLLFYQGFPETPRIVDVGFVRKALKLLVGEVLDGDSIGEYLLALESQYFPTESFKTAKELLKARPTSLRLYNAYGLVESRRNCFERADHVFSAALSTQNGDSAFSTSGSLEIFYSWVWEALRRSDGEEALWRLVSPTGKIEKVSGAEGAPNQAALLRAQRTLNDTCERALLASHFSRAAMATSLIAILTYFSSNEKPEAALLSFSRLSTWLSRHNMSQSSAAEIHAQYVAQFLILHTERARIVKPALLRETLEPLIAKFPDNTILLSLYAANEARFAIDDRVRSIMHQRSQDKDRTIVSWTFAIHHETLRGEIAGSTSHSIRALIGKAEEDIGAHCPALWKQHVLFEIAEARKEHKKLSRIRPRKDGKRSKEEIRVGEAHKRVKDTFFRGLTHLPWCKDYMMMAFTHLGEEFLGQEDLRKVYNVMVEKELRVYVEIEEPGA
ncbi:uncharacterized protein N0V89_000776 [Didymosphaeria variabile]|uniref:DUF1740-domain-containing protein n=1 Tax=Didymosphaeria variabile TaxID=1932322 RepID=A0A9W9CG62_9PLEO|nr:uncharacterized protein N0V89_000776 [Didymosphaeria variabile]KAJ4360216.1 hypothetical protein N0V89_000776 [Didymosphaeria variabile]